MVNQNEWPRNLRQNPLPPAPPPAPQPQGETLAAYQARMAAQVAPAPTFSIAAIWETVAAALARPGKAAHPYEFPTTDGRAVRWLATGTPVPAGWANCGCFMDAQFAGSADPATVRAHLRETIQWGRAGIEWSNP